MTTPTSSPKTKNSKWLPVLVIVLLVGVILDLILSFIVIVGTIRVNNVASANHQLKVGEYTSCLSANLFRAADLTRWNRVLVLINTMPKNPKQQAFVHAVDAANQIADRPRDCGRAP